MRRTLALSLTLLVSCSLARVGAAATPAPGTAAKEQAIRQAEKIYVDGLLKADIGSLGQLFADDYTVIKNHGEYWDKATHLGFIEAEVHRFLKLSTGDVKIRFYDDVALVTGRLDWQARDPDATISGHSRYTHVYVKRDGRWQMVHNHFHRYGPQEKRPLASASGQ
jgi:ketosteroid isomerase-like protein